MAELSPRRGARTLAVAVALTSAALALTSCASAPDAAATREQVSQATRPPADQGEREELQLYDASRHPEPLVEPRECTPYLVITARGTNEKPKNQLLSPVARAIGEARSGEVATVDLDYPADSDVRLGGTRGVRLLIDTLDVQTDACPDQRFILLGYSQGALIVGDALTAPDLRLVGEAAGEVSGAAASRILAIVLYGDPRFLGTEPYDAGDFDPRMHGVLPRPAGSLAQFEGRLRDYCVAKDIVCQSSLDLEEKGHVAYFANGMQQGGADFVIERLPPREATAPNPPADPDRKRRSR